MMRNLFAGAEIVEAGDHAGLTRSVGDGELPDLILLDLLFPGFEATRDFAGLRRSLPVTPIVAVSMVHDNGMIDAVMEAGANGFVSKTARPDDMATALKAVMDGETVILRASGGVPLVSQEDGLGSLTGRQLDVLRFMAKGLSNKQIARELGISPYTVRVHVSAVLRTLSLPSRAAAASFAAARGFS